MKNIKHQLGDLTKETVKNDIRIDLNESASFFVRRDCSLVLVESGHNLFRNYLWNVVINEVKYPLRWRI